MGFLKRTRSFLHEKKSAITNKSPALSSLSEEPEDSVPPIQTRRSSYQIPTIQSRHVLQKPSDPTYYVTAEHVRELRELIRLRYALDIEIWSQKDLKGFKRDNLKRNMVRSDAIMVAIRQTLQEWDRQELFAREEEYRKFKEIKERLAKGNKIVWAKHPPWTISKKQPPTIRAPYEKDAQPSAASHWDGSYDYQHSPRRGPEMTYAPQPNQRNTRQPQQAQRISSATQQRPENRYSSPQSQLSISTPQHVQYGAPSQQAQYAAQPLQPNPYAMPYMHQGQNVGPYFQDSRTSVPPSQQNPYSSTSSQQGQSIGSPPRTHQSAVSPQMQNYTAGTYTPQDQRLISPPHQEKYVAYNPYAGSRHDSLQGSQGSGASQPRGRKGGSPHQQGQGPAPS